MGIHSTMNQMSESDHEDGYREEKILKEDANYI